MEKDNQNENPRKNQKQRRCEWSRFFHILPEGSENKKGLVFQSINSRKKRFRNAVTPDLKIRKKFFETSAPNRKI
ncbi:hypothetical protein LEP1GSC052_4200 [Leptospira kmetyi serovar Malaysia str. Bejo-Iso9]|nr:hypothetical protein LEP1GSC052_4200 [Leptospira kmetyi serovar Malaysia str. Bejo-Iso9]